MSAETAAALRTELLTRLDGAGSRPAMTGRGDGERTRSDVRTDRIAWCDETLLEACPTVRSWHTAMKHLGGELATALRLPICAFDGHATRYGPGGFYRPHVDAPLGASRRLLSAVLYLDAARSADDGGALRLWPTPTAKAPASAEDAIDLAPKEGALVLFRSAGLWHEVRPTRTTRLSLTGWFLGRS